ncbi:MAG: DUF3164 family protein [Pseudomonadota bacterium]
MTQQETKIPAGYMEDSRGALMPIDRVREIDRLRDNLVREIVAGAISTHQVVARFKANSMSDIEAFVDLSAERFGVKRGGKKGNIVLTSYDGRYRIIRAIDENIVFDERLQIAKDLVDDCIHRWAEGSSTEIMALITEAFQVDKQGKINVRGILRLRRLNIEDETWQKAMTAIGESLQTVGSKAYLRVYEQDANGEYQQISLDTAR